MIGHLAALLATDAGPQSLGLSGKAQVLVLCVCFVGALFLLRLLRSRQLRGKYTLLWIVTVAVMLGIAAFPGMIDRFARSLNIYSPPNALFLLGIVFLLMVCIYFSYELSRLEERTRILAEELAILRGDLHAPDQSNVGSVGSVDSVDSVETGKAAGETERSS